MRRLDIFSVVLLGIVISLITTPIISNINQIGLAQESDNVTSLAGIQSDRNAPNILMIVGDDFGFADIGAFGGTEISTPNLDALANEGKVLTNYHTVTVCSPARAAMLTGVDHHIGGIGTMYEIMAENQVGKPGYEGYLNDKVVTVAELLRDSGYHTYQSGKWHLSGGHLENGTFPSDKGFEQSLTLINGGANHFNGFPELPLEKITFQENGKIIPRPGNNTLYSNDLYTDKMMEYIMNSTDEKPFFGYLAYQAAHSPFQSPQETVSKYDKIYGVGWDKIREQRFDKQKEFGFWPLDMELPERIPPIQPWAELSSEQQAYASRILAIRAAMIENMDENIGRLIQLLKDTGKYDNTLIIFASDNGSVEPVPMTGVEFAAVSPEIGNFVKQVNNTLSNPGNGTSQVNYAAWGVGLSTSPLSGYKTTQYEGGTRAPFIMKEPVLSSSSTSGSNMSNPNLIKAFTYVNDITPTILEYAGVQHPGSTYNGMPVHPIMGKSLKSLFNGTADRVYGENEMVADEMFNNTAVYMGDWKAIKHEPPVDDGKWQLYNLTDNPTETINIADQHPDILQKLVSGYDTYSKDVGVVIPRGQAYIVTLTSATPPVNQTQDTITSVDIQPQNFSQSVDNMTMISNMTGGNITGGNMTMGVLSADL
jgi:arylsulfatase A-like enzyme